MSLTQPDIGRASSSMDLGQAFFKDLEVSFAGTHVVAEWSDLLDIGCVYRPMNE